MASRFGYRLRTATTRRTHGDRSISRAIRSVIPGSWMLKGRDSAPTESTSSVTFSLTQSGVCVKRTCEGFTTKYSRSSAYSPPS